MSWEKVRLGDCCSKIGSGSTPKGGSTVYIEAGVSFIRSQNIYNLQFDYSGLTHITDEAAKKLNGVTIHEGDILINITGDSVARTCVVPTDVLPARVNQHVSIVRPDAAVLDYRFLNYYLASPYMQSFMLGLAVGKGASRNAMTKDMIANYEVPCPPLETQHRIANILSAYDNLVKNNQKQIKLLEDAAQRLYKEWFVDLHFPGYEDTKIVDGVPEGWKKFAIEELCNKVNSGGTPSRNNKDYYSEKGYRWFKTKELLDCWLIDSEEHISSAGLDNSSAKLFPPNTIVMAIYASPTLGRLGILRKESCTNQAALCMNVNSENCSWQWLYSKLYELRDEFNAIARGAGQQNISGDTVKNTRVLLPSKEILDKFTTLVAPFFEKQYVLAEQIAQLIEARDRMLPKLMSGELEV